MLKNYFKIALRNILRHKGYSFINIFGLAVGMACFLIISLWCIDELSYDNFHENIDRLYRVNTIESNDRIIPNSSLRLGREMKAIYPEMEAYTNFIPWARSLMTYKDKSYDEQNIYLVDPEFFSMFSFHFVAGDPSKILKDKYSIVITEETAQKYFGIADPIGKKVYSDIFQRDFMVSAVVKSLPLNSTLQFNIAASINHIPKQRMESWEFSGWTYILLKENVSEQKFNDKIKNFYQDHVDSEWNAQLRLQKFSSLHLYQTGKQVFAKLVYIFSFTAVFVLIIAFINFVNLSTSKATEKTLEIGVRKVIGANKLQLVVQFLSESILVAFNAMLFAIIIVEVSLPFFNKFAAKNLQLIGGNFVEHFFVLLSFALFCGIISGCYPAFFLSSMKPVTALKSNYKGDTSGLLFRKILIIGQFVISIGLIISTIIVHKQLQFVQKVDIGLNRENVLIIPSNPILNKEFDSYRSELIKNSNVLNVSSSATIPVNVGQRIGINWEGHMNEDSEEMRYTMVDYDFFSTFDMDIIQGRAFSRDYSADSVDAVIINEKALSIMGFDEPIGKIVYFGHPAFPKEKRHVKIIGVVKDFHYSSLHSLVGPFIFRMYRPWHSFIFAKLNKDNIQGTVAKIEDVTTKFTPEYPFTFEFLDDTYNYLYIAETKTGEVFSIFAVIAMIISCLGLLGLAVNTVKQKTKEIGIRKVLGSSVTQIFIMLSSEFIKWVLIANIVAWPLTYYLMSKWLQTFEYKINMEIWIFIVSGIIAFVISILTVSLQSVKSSNSKSSR